MNQLCFAFALIAGALSSPQQATQQVGQTAQDQVATGAPIKAPTIPTSEPFRVRYGQVASGREVQISIDGGAVRTTYAGKLIFGDGTNMWTSVCANVRAPISNGQIFAVRSRSSKSAGDRIAKAGNIVAKYFKEARTPDQCAGLQLAVWEALEDGGDKPDFANGRFRARANRAALEDAEKYYDGIWIGDEAVFFETGQEGGQGQLTART